ncbi:MAG: ATPase, partial [Chloroflexota bacterium]|nr:ATPase [Chloroflexota bacterium]
MAQGGLSLPPVPQQPTASDIGHAREMLLDDLLGDFPFVADEHKEHEEADKANILAAILTPLVRPLVDGPTPLFCIEAPIEGSGKGLLAYVIACVTTGGPPAIMTEGGDDDEWRKRLTAALMKTPPILLIDNVRRRLDAGALSATITATVWSDRLMGHSRLVSIPVRTTWLVTANNPTFSGEIGRRVVRIRIDAAVERPWERVEFRIEDLRAWTRRERPRLLWAALTLARAWVVRGRPKGTEVMGSFKDWAATLGGILGVAGVQGLLTNRECVYLQVQTEGEAWVALLNVWWEKYGGQRVGVAQLFDLASQHKLLTDLRAGREERGARTALGMELAQLRDRIIGAYCIRQVGVAPG